MCSKLQRDSQTFSISLASVLLAMERNPRGKNGRQIPRSAREEWLLHFNDQISSFPDSFAVKPLKGKELSHEVEFRPKFILCRRREGEIVREGTCSFSGASHPPEPVDANMMRPICLNLGHLKADAHAPLSSSSLLGGHGCNAKDLPILMKVDDLPSLLCGHGSSTKDLSIMVKKHDVPNLPPHPPPSSSFLCGYSHQAIDLSAKIKGHDVPDPPSSSSSFLSASSFMAMHGSSTKGISIMNKEQDLPSAPSSSSPSSSSLPSPILSEHGSRGNEIPAITHHHDKQTASSSPSSTSSHLEEQDSRANTCIWDSSPNPLKTERLPKKEIQRIEPWDSGKTSLSSNFSEDSLWSTDPTVINACKPHRGNDLRWKAVLAVRSRDGNLGMGHFRLIQRLGCGDIGSVYLSELSGTRCNFAVKVMDKVSLEKRKKMARAQTEREILECLDHPFLPTLYSHFETERFSCLVMEYCPGGDLHTLRQRQPGKRFSEYAARFYAAEVLLALEYLHMLGVIYRDLKPENVLVRDDGHIMLSDFDLSLRCSVSPTLIHTNPKTPQTLKDPSCLQPSCFLQRKKPKKKREKVELVAEPTAARSTSFVGTHEYLAPEIIKGEGHGAAVDWWTFGIFLYELMYGSTPFKGGTNRGTLFNVVGQPLKFPETPAASGAAREMIGGLLAKEPGKRMGVRRGAAEIKQHPFFAGVNWALIRCSTPPEVPMPAEKERQREMGGEDWRPGGRFLDFEFF